jgi:hypothetical protein
VDNERKHRLIDGIIFRLQSLFKKGRRFHSVPAALVMQSLTDMAPRLPRHGGQRFGQVGFIDRGRDKRKRLRKIAAESRRRNRHAA